MTDVLTPYTNLNLPAVIAIVVLDDIGSAVPLARALVAGGIHCIELTLRTSVALEAIRRICAEVPEMLVGAGTILTPEQVNDACAAGAAFGVAPGMNPRVVAEARLVDLLFAPGVCTPTDIEIALEHGCRLLKFFPSEPCGGIAYLRSVAAPFAHLGVKYIALGGITPESIESYLREPMVSSVGGSWMTSREWIQLEEWPTITAKAHETTTMLKQVRGNTPAMK
jgi:2-dehydro-3-deoxyphosphogluconate aldolase/(4S)-4-hydroxy-2-oxoglutarate aldolase